MATILWSAVLPFNPQRHLAIIFPAPSLFEPFRSFAPRYQVEVWVITEVCWRKSWSHSVGTVVLNRGKESKDVNGHFFDRWSSKRWLFEGPSYGRVEKNIAAPAAPRDQRGRTSPTDGEDLL